MGLSPSQIVFLTLAIFLLLSVMAFAREHIRRTGLERFAGVKDVDDEIKKLERKREKFEAGFQSMRELYAEKREVLSTLEREMAVYDDRLAFAELGVYEPHFDFKDSEEFKRQIRKVCESQKSMVQSKTAVVCNTSWQVEGSRAKGRTMTNRQIRLTLRAFNNECEAAIANTRWNNVNAMERRIRNAATQIDKLNASSNVSIEPEYIDLNLEELFLTHEYRESKKLERDERALVARKKKEEQKLIREAKEAGEEEENYLKLLEKARMEALSSDGVDRNLMQEKILELEESLANAHAKLKRAQSMAQMTRSGYVYIVSNVGSFGAHVVKIGMTRRLDPDDRVRELGDASVPFVFDTHAMIYSDDAPTLEAALHSEFSDRRINAVNMRKEFFSVSLEEVEDAVIRLAPSAKFFRDCEAQDYFETLARRSQKAAQIRAQASSKLPAMI